MGDVFHSNGHGGHLFPLQVKGQCGGTAEDEKECCLGEGLRVESVQKGKA